MNDILDYRLQHWLRSKIDTLPASQQFQLRNLARCMHTPIPQKGVKEGVYLLRNDNSDVRYFGMATCKNTWACPHCAAVRMKEYEAKIAAAIDALEKTHYGIMITFTIPHIAKQTCREVTDLLYSTWRSALANCFRQRNSKKGTLRFMTPFNKFMVTHGVKHYVRACEYTWGKNGWHPHFHCIFFLDPSTITDVLSFENDLNAAWNSHFERQLNKLFGDKYSDTMRERLLKSIRNKECKSVVISRQSDNKPLKVTSSAYVAGWTTDRELTGNVQKKASHEGHYTPHQILELAADGNEAFADLYIEFCLQVTRKPVHHRVNFSKTGLTAIAQNKINQEGYISVLKKKRELGQWKVVAFFDKQQWYSLFSVQNAIENCAIMAKYNLLDLLSDYVLLITGKPLVSQLPIFNHIENIFNGVAA